MAKQVDLVNKAFAKNDLENKEKINSANQVKFEIPQIITIARDPGSGGKPIASLVAKKLGFHLYDEDLITQISVSTNEPKSKVKTVDETQKSLVEKIVTELLQPNHLSQDQFVSHLNKVVNTITGIGKAVILGRGCNFIIPKEKALNIYITAPLKIRIERAVAYENIDNKEARERINRISKERKLFVSENFSKSYTHANNYDLIINTEFLDIKGAAEVIIRAYKKKFGK